MMKLKKRNLIAGLLLLSMVVQVFLPVTSLAEDYGDMYYKQIKDLMYKRSGIKVDTPEPNFKIMAHGKEIAREVAGDVLYDALKYGDKANEDIPVKAVVPLGTELTAISFSEPGMPNSKIKKYDWQMTYRDPNFKSYPDTYRKSDKSVFKQVADKPGYIIFFLNVADDYDFLYKGTKKRILFTNWSDQGKRRTAGGVGDGGDYRAIDWYYTPIKIQVVDSNENMVMKEMEVQDLETGKVLNTYKRTIKPDDPFNPKKHYVSTAHKDGSIYVEKGKKYKIKAKYQFISFKEGNFDISKPGTMTEKQKNITTEIDKNQVIGKVALDNKFGGEKLINSNNKPYIRLKNLEEATFEYTETVPNNVKRDIKFKPVIPSYFDPVNVLKEDDFAELTFKVKSTDLAAKPPVMLFRDNELTNSLVKGKKQRGIITFVNKEGDVTIGKDPNTNPKFTANLTVKDKNGKILVDDLAQTQKEMPPKGEITFQTSEFTPTTDEITVCGKVNKIHNELGLNHDETNDMVCTTFTANAPDIGMKAPVKLKLRGKDTNNVQIGGDHKVEFNLHHYSGSETVGTELTAYK